VEILAEDKAGGDIEASSEEMSLMMIKALVDEFSISKPADDRISITMTKRHKDIVLEP
jgi:hypothetical protein